MYEMVDHYLNTSSDIVNIKAFRGSGKSINTVILALYLVATGRKRYVLIVSDTAHQAEALIADIQSLVDESGLGLKVERSITGEIELVVDGRSSYIVGKGAGSSMRGIKRGRMRPDLVITDDLMNDMVAQNRLRSERLKRWVFQVLMPSMEPGAPLWNVGTPLSQGDVFSYMCDNYPTLEIPISDDVWPDRFPPEWIDRKRDEYSKAGMLRAWKSEYELILTDSETRVFDTSRINVVDESSLPGSLSWYCTLDGAFSEAQSADYSAFAVVGIDAYGRWYVAPYGLRSGIDRVIDRLFELQSRYGFLEAGIEKGSFRLAVQHEIERRMIDYQQYFTVNELNTTGSKISRIKALVPVVNGGRLTIVDTGEDAELLMEQLELTDSTACLASHDDHLDALCQMIQMPLHYNEGAIPTREDYEGYMEPRPNPYI